MCNNCIHKSVCSIYDATGGVKHCEYYTPVMHIVEDLSDGALE